MTDRLPTYPGLVKLTDPDDGTFKLYYMEMADAPSIAGTPLNKNTLLSDAAAAAVWPVAGDRPSDPLVSEALSALAAGRMVVLADGVSYTNSTASAVYMTVPLNEPRQIDVIAIAKNAKVAVGAISIIDDGNNAHQVGGFNQSKNIEWCRTIVLTNSDDDGFNAASLEMAGTGPVGQQAFFPKAKLTGSTMRLTVSAEDEDGPVTQTVWVFGTRL